MKEAIIKFAAGAYELLLPVSWVAFLIAVVILIPMAFFTKTRGQAAIGIYICSFIFGTTTWFLGLVVTMSAWGWVGLIVGVLIAGIGVVPVGILAAFISVGDSSLGFSLIGMSVITIITQIVAVSLAKNSA